MQNIQHVISAIEMNEDAERISNFSSRPHLEVDNLHGFQIRVNTQNEGIPQNHLNLDGSGVKAKKEPLTQQTTGYDMKRQMYSSKQLAQAFKIIDFNKDDLITYEDISFFLDYIQEKYTHEEITEMIDLVKPGATKLTREDFYKIGQGEIIPLAGFRVPQPDANLKQALLTNITAAFPKIPPNQVLEAVKTGKISLSNFEEEKKKENKKKNVTKIQENTKNYQELNSILQLISQEEMAIRKIQFQAAGTVNLRQILQNYRQCEETNLNTSQISALLKISERQTRRLYTNKTMRAKSVVVEAIVYSSTNSLKKIDLLLQILTPKRFIAIDQLLHAIGLMQGKQNMENTRMKMLALFKYLNKNLKEPIQKEEALALLSQYSYDFRL